MSSGEIIIVQPEAEPEAEAVTVSEVTALIDEAIDEVIEAVTSEDESGHTQTVDFLAGVTVAALEALTAPVGRLESRTESTKATADLAVELAETAIVEAQEPPVVDVEPEPVVEPDEPPPTW